ncbi:MAG: ATP-dependent DNA ligase, partial [Alphaproteobacteria bacterium]
MTRRDREGPALSTQITPMEARLAKELPERAGYWQYEPKWDGFRCLAFNPGGRADLRGKSGSG